MTSPSEFPGPAGRPASFDDWVQAFKEQVSFFTALRFGPSSDSSSGMTAAPRWPLADVLPVLPFVGVLVGGVAGVEFAVVRGLFGSGWLAAVLAVGTAILLTRALHEDGLADTADGLGPHGLKP
ncbi:MAG: adenosylcobinamide-GDP ribazoletransferase, partial [Alphaproteobacteria bacterium]|nr:adenosylcobinamide-GDP ribazoletransferase [Alphaproteobacteria bacterium]